MADHIMVPISPGELIDKLTILQIKAERIGDPQKRANVVVERDALAEVVKAETPQDAEMTALTDDLRAVNTELWEIEDAIREQERQKTFGEEFIRLARSVYVTNDRRATLKKTINERLGSRLVEEKSYTDYL